MTALRCSLLSQVQTSHPHDRQIVVLAPDKGMGWLTDPSEKILRPPPKGGLGHRLLRKNGIMLQ
jgi:putative SOS response-associated peptidase YedK